MDKRQAARDLARRREQAEDFILHAAGEAGLIETITAFLAEMEASENAEAHALDAPLRAKALELKHAGDERDEEEIIADLAHNHDQLSAIKHEAIFEQVEAELAARFEEFDPPAIADLLAAYKHEPEDLEAYPTE